MNGSGHSPEKAEFVAAHATSGLRDNTLVHAWNIDAALSGLGYVLEDRLRARNPTFAWQHERHRARVVAVEHRSCWEHLVVTPDVSVDCGHAVIRSVAAAALPGIDPDRLARLAAHRNPAVRLAAAHNPRLTEDAIAAAVASESDSRVLSALVRHPNASDAVKAFGALAR